MLFYTNTELRYEQHVFFTNTYLLDAFLYKHRIALWTTRFLYKHRIALWTTRFLYKHIFIRRFFTNIELHYEQHVFWDKTNDVWLNSTNTLFRNLFCTSNEHFYSKNLITLWTNAVSLNRFFLNDKLKNQNHPLCQILPISSNPDVARRWDSSF